MGDGDEADAAVSLMLGVVVAGPYMVVVGVVRVSNTVDVVVVVSIILSVAVDVTTTVLVAIDVWTTLLVVVAVSMIVEVAVSMSVVGHDGDMVLVSVGAVTKAMACTSRFSSSAWIMGIPPICTSGVAPISIRVVTVGDEVAVVVL